MNYELAKQLKDAGFPSGKSLRGAVKKDNTPLTIGESSDKSIEWVETPSLSELIEACGENFLSLSKGINDELSDRRGYRLSYATSIKNPNEKFVGKNPESAVAALWLSLQK